MYHISSSGGVIESVGPLWLADGRVQWRLRLEEAKDRYSDYEFYTVFGLESFFNRLIAATETIIFVPANSSDYNALFSNGTIRHVGQIADLNIETIIHESVHALDWANNWYLDAPLTGLQSAEALGWTSQHLWERLKEFKKTEDYLCSNEANSEARIQGLWYNVAFTLSDWSSDPVKWKYGLISYERFVEIADIIDVESKPGLTLHVSAIRDHYIEMAQLRGLTFNFPTTVVKEGLPPRTIPGVFLD